MDREKKSSGKNADAMLVDKAALCNAIESVADEALSQEMIFVEAEPLLSAYCRAALLQILGKLAISGASPKVVRGVGADIHHLITVTAKAMRSGYCILLEDFLPEFATAASETTTQATEEDGADT